VNRVLAFDGDMIYLLGAPWRRRPADLFGAGRPVTTRLQPVSVPHRIVRMFAHGDSIESLLGAYPSITREDILACLDYAASLAEDRLSPLAEVVLSS